MVIDLYGPIYFIAIWLEEVWGFITAWDSPSTIHFNVFKEVHQVPPTLSCIMPARQLGATAFQRRRPERFKAFSQKRWALRKRDKAFFCILFTFPYFTSLSLSMDLSLSQPYSQSMSFSSFLFYPILFVHCSALALFSVPSTVSDAYHSYSRS